MENNKEMTIGFSRDTQYEDEFYLEIICKNPNKNGEFEKSKIPVDDIDEIEHVEGTLQFYIHF